MNDVAVILLALILATMLLGRDLIFTIVGASFGLIWWGGIAFAVWTLLVGLTNGAIIEWGKVAFALVFVAAYGFLFSYLIWNGLKWMWTRLTGGQDNG